MNIISRTFVCSSVIVFSIFLRSCTSNTQVAQIDPKKLVKYDSVGYYSKERVQAVIDSVLDIFMEGKTRTPSEFRSRLTPARHGVTLCKVTYSSVIPEKNNQKITAYGLLVIPDIILPGAPIISYQHGSIFDRSWAPSNPDGSIEIQFAISQFASQGYIVIAADYFGTTVSSKMPPCFGVPGSTGQACLDMLIAAKQVLIQKNISPGKLFINGWSLGGASTNTFLRRLEKEQIPVTAAVTASGPADQLTFFQKMINEPSSFISPYFSVTACNALFSYEEYVGLNGYAAASIKPEFLDAAQKFYRFEIPFAEYAKKVLLDSAGNWRYCKDIFTPKFIEESKTATLPFWNLLDDANGYRWSMRTPYRAFYSNRDEGVIGATARVIVEYQKNIGNKNIEGFNAGANADHASVYLESIINAKPWFDSFQ
jgi:hypothetical protein